MSEDRVYNDTVLNPGGTKEDKSRCVEEVQNKPGLGWGPHQCERKRGYGPNGEYCKQHAKRHNRRNELNTDSVCIGEFDPRDTSWITEPVNPYRAPRLSMLDMGYTRSLEFLYVQLDKVKEEYMETYSALARFESSARVIEEAFDTVIALEGFIRAAAQRYGITDEQVNEILQSNIEKNRRRGYYGEE